MNPTQLQCTKTERGKSTKKISTKLDDTQKRRRRSKSTIVKWLKKAQTNQLKSYDPND